MKKSSTLLYLILFVFIEHSFAQVHNTNNDVMKRLCAGIERGLTVYGEPKNEVVIYSFYPLEMNINCNEIAVELKDVKFAYRHKILKKNRITVYFNLENIEIIDNSITYKFSQKYTNRFKLKKVTHIYLEGYITYRYEYRNNAWYFIE